MNSIVVLGRSSAASALNISCAAAGLSLSTTCVQGMLPGFVSVTWYALAGIILFCAYLRLSSTYAENSDMANVLLMGWDLLHGNPLLHGWRMSDVSFYPTELVQYALLESVL